VHPKAANLIQTAHIAFRARSRHDISRKSRPVLKSWKKHVTLPNGKQDAIKAQ
jgi:hypothetical protein